MATTTRYGYSPSQAGENLLAFCAKARETLLQQLEKPSHTDEAAYAAYVKAKMAIHQMDHRELRATLQAAESAQPVSSASTMLQVQVTINTVNAAFDADPIAETVRILRELADQFEQGAQPTIIRDRQHNRCGEVLVFESQGGC